MLIRIFAFALFAFAGMSPALAENSSVSLYGIADAAVRHVTNTGSKGRDATSGTTSMTSGMSQSRLGVRAAEDLGGGYSAIAHLEHRFEIGEGTPAANAPFWQQAYVGLATPAGRLTLGRQYNVLFDLHCSTFASFQMSPYVEAFKPEMGFALGARQSDMVKYVYATQGLTLEAQWSMENGEKTTGSVQNTTFSYRMPNKSRGFIGRYQNGGISVGAGVLDVKDSGGLKAVGTTWGGSYTTGGLTFNLSWLRNRYDVGFGSVTAGTPAVASAIQTQLMNTIVDSPTTGVVGGAVDKRDLYSIGASYNLNEKVLFGAQYWDMRQDGVTAVADGQARMAALVASYNFSKRTEVYAELDRTLFDSGAVTLANGERQRTGTMLGMRHRF